MKSYCYTVGVLVHKMLLQMLKSMNFNLFIIFSCIVTLFIIHVQKSPLQQKLAVVMHLVTAAPMVLSTVNLKTVYM